MRLIDADELQKKLAEMLVDDKLGGKEFIRLYELVREQYVFRVGQYGKWRINLEELVDASATTNAEPVVRCKDCKYLYRDDYCPLRTWVTHTEDDFCSYGELLRREDEQIG